MGETPVLRPLEKELVVVWVGLNRSTPCLGYLFKAFFFFGDLKLGKE